MSKSKVHAGSLQGNAKKVAALGVSAALVLGICIPLQTMAFAENEEADIVVMEEQPMPTFKGSQIVQRYIDGYTLTLEELQQIDLVALSDWDKALAEKLMVMKQELEKRAAEESAAGSGDGQGSQAETSDSATDPAGAQTDSTVGGEEAKTDIPDVTTDPASPVEPEDVEPAIMPDDPSAIDDPFDATQIYPEWFYFGDTSFNMIHYTQDMDAQKLIAAIGESAREVAQEHEVSASQTIALAVVLSNSGRNVAAQAPTRNLFRLYDQQTGAFEAYASYKKCIEDYAERVERGEIPALPDNDEWSGIAGSLTERVQDTIESYDLVRYDLPLTYEPASQLMVSAWSDDAQGYVDQPASLADLADIASAQLGVPYVWGGSSPSGFDCSGLVQFAYAHALQTSIPRTTYYQCLNGQDVDFADLHTGDLLFFVRDGVAGHVGMYLGEGCYIEAPQPGMEVKITAMDEKRPTFAKRLIDTIPRIVEEAVDEADIDEASEAIAETTESAFRVAVCEILPSMRVALPARSVMQL